VAAAYIFFQKDQIFLYRLIDGLFIGGMLPMILGCFRLAKYAGSFDLLVYSHKKLARSGKNSDLSQEEKDPGSSAAPAPEQLGSYSDYLTQKKPAGKNAPKKTRRPPIRSRFWPEASLSWPPCF